ncbi:MAG: sensor histidine kinase, partial [Chitinophagaceae bacterium]
IQTAWPFLLIVPAVICTLMTVTFIVMSQHIITYIFWIFLFMLLIINPISWLVFKQVFKSFSELHQLKVDLGNTSANLLFLRTQINPHFLFNALNTIYGTAIQENAPRTSEAAQKLGDMMRFMLHENTLDHIPLEREIQYLNNYISLQTLRTAGSDKIRIETQIEDNYHIHQVAPMLLIPFVENAFKHGISLRHNSWIRINLQTSDNTLVFDVSNSIHLRTPNDTEKDQSGVGLDNVKQRLALLYPGKHHLSIHQNNYEFFIHLTITLN